MAGLLLVVSGSAQAELGFSDQTANANFLYQHGWVDLADEEAAIAGGVAAGDYDRDGWVDVYVVRGDIGPNLLFHNNGNGTFTEVGVAAGVSGAPAGGSGPIFADLDGDGWLDLVVGGILGDPPAVYSNLGDGTFSAVANSAGLDHGLSQFSASLADIDRDGDLDLATTHWLEQPGVQIWENAGDGTFSNVTAASGVGVVTVYGFTPVFTDLNEDGWPDLVVSADFGTSQVFMNDGDGSFTLSTTGVIDDENGMGAALADFDNDGDQDWFVSSIWDPNGFAEGNWGVTGNRLYENLGGGSFANATTTSGLRQGYWGWGSCFADFDNDGWLDLFHVNGMLCPLAICGDPSFPPEFISDPSRLFLSNGDGTFTEASAARGIVDTGQGRGILCFDYDRDGDLDIFIANNSAAPALYRNDGVTNHFLQVRLKAPSPNTRGIGAKVTITIGGNVQVREVRAGSNFASSNPSTVHFGLAGATVVDEVRVDWPYGGTSIRKNVAADQILQISQYAAIPMSGPVARITLGLLLMASGLVAARRRSRPAKSG